MATRSFLFCAAVLVMLSPCANASDNGESGAAMRPSEAIAVAASAVPGIAARLGEERESCEPTIGSKVSLQNRRKISTAFELALGRVRDVPECRELFGRLGADAEEVLDRTVFFPIGRAEALGNVCNSSRAAYTHVGGGPIWVCRHFKRLSDVQAAMVIIHESLHHAGLTEYPQDPDAMTSNAINQMVMTRCGL